MNYEALTQDIAAALARFEANGNGDKPPEPGPVILPDLDEFLEGDDGFDWLVPGLIERGDRIIVTAHEGGGKSTLLRQLAVQFACGVHPFTLDAIDPLKVMFIDAENSPRQIRRKLRPLREAAGTSYRTGQMRPHIIGEPLDLGTDIHAAHLTELVTSHQPDVLIIGPLYKLQMGDPKAEDVARRIAGTFDRLRSIHGTAIFIEAHSPYAEGSKSTRPIRPYGASLWSRWPEFGLHIADTGRLDHWRGPREEREWPKALCHSTPWPWAPASTDDDSEWHGPTACATAVVGCVEAAGELSLARLRDAVRATGATFRNGTIDDAAALAVLDGRLTVRVGPRSSRLYALAQPQQVTDEQF